MITPGTYRCTRDRRAKNMIIEIVRATPVPEDPRFPGQVDSDWFAIDFRYPSDHPAAALKVWAVLPEHLEVV